MDLDFKKLLAFGSGIGIQIAGPRGAETLEIAAARVRLNRAQLLGRLTIPGFSRQPAAAWGGEYAAFLRKHDVRHASAAAILPRHEVVVRALSLPGVSNKDLDAAVGFQLEGLHPYGENDVVAAWSRIGGSSTVLVAIARRAAIDRYASLFAEAGIRLRSTRRCGWPRRRAARCCCGRRWRDTPSITGKVRRGRSIPRRFPPPSRAPPRWLPRSCASIRPRRRGRWSRCCRPRRRCLTPPR